MVERIVSVSVIIVVMRIVVVLFVLLDFLKGISGGGFGVEDEGDDMLICGVGDWCCVWYCICFLKEEKILFCLLRLKFFDRI